MTAQKALDLPMRCGGCGAKVGNSILQRVMAELQPVTHNSIIIGLNSPDDAAVIQPPPGNTGYRDGNRMGRDGIRDYMAYCAELCQKYPDRFSGAAGVDTTRGMQGLRDLERAVKDYGFVAAH